MNISDSESGRSQDFDINLAPIIDCFTVLITFMLASASFLAIGIFESTLPGPAAASAEPQPNSILLEAELTMSKEIQLRISGKAKLTKKLPAKSGEYDVAGLLSEIENAKRRFPQTNSLILSAADDVEYLQVIRMMEALKPQISTTVLGGF